MKNQRITADNFEQLIEIVKAVSRGKDPEEALRGGAEDEDLLFQEKSEEETLLREGPGDRTSLSRSAPPDAEPLPAEPAGEESPQPDDTDVLTDAFPDEERTPEERAEDERLIDRLLFWRDREKPGADEPENKPDAQEETPMQTAPPGRVRQILSGLREYLRELRDNLYQKGFQGREAMIAGIGALLAVCVAAMIIHSVMVSRAEKRKMENVTSDEGLTVLVEDEPGSWCTSYPVALTVRSAGAAIQKVSVNGRDYAPGTDGRIVADADSELLELTVTTDQGDRKAQVRIPRIDVQPPVLNVSREKDQIVATASDARSEIGRIRYAVRPSNAWLELPRYQDYNGPVVFEPDMVYYFYAQDAAGNRCAPVITTMENPRSLGLAQEEVAMFPGESCSLMTQVEPEGAFLNNLKYESADPKIASVDGSGLVTAVGEGSTVVSVSADGVRGGSCKVVVSASRTVTVSAIGDCTLGTDEAFNTDTNFNAFDAVHGHEWFFQNVRDILGKDDVTFANLEGTLTTSTQREVKQFAFKGDPSYTQILQDGSVEVVTLANNHSSDYGAQSLEDTKAALEEAGIDYCKEEKIVLRELNGIRTAFIGIYVLDDGMASETQLREAIAQAREAGAQIVIVAFHWGTESTTQPDQTQQELAHIAVDEGANLVVGHHPHVLQGIEKYNGAYIVYSLGNFCFGGNQSPSDKDTIIFRQTFTVGRDGVIDDDRIDIIPCRISSTSDYNDYQPTPLQGEEAERVIGRVNEYSAAYGLTFTASAG